MKMKFISDVPVEFWAQDELGFCDFVDLIQSSFQYTESPFVYGVLGGWGTGKTSILRLLESRLTDQSHESNKVFIPIWFNAWQYENEVNVVYPLFHAIYKKYKDVVGGLDQGQEFLEKFRQIVWSSALALTDIGLRTVTKQLTGEALKLADIANQVDVTKERSNDIYRVLNNWADNVDQLQKAFDLLLNNFARDYSRFHGDVDVESIRFVILIDDLDRCLPDTTLAILESIKNFFLVSNCIFVLGLNPEVVYQGIRLKYKGLDVDGREYLEKILNYSFFVPEPELKRISVFAEKHLENLVLDVEERNQYRNHFVEFGQVIQICRFTNPRKIKRILNRYLLFIGKYHQQLRDFHNPNIVRLIILAEYFPDLFQLFLKDASQAKRQLLQVCSGELPVQEFEQQFAVSVANKHHQLTKMKALFDLDLSLDMKNDLQGHCQAVFQITRLV